MSDIEVTWPWAHVQAKCETLRPGQFTFLAGELGGGKSTLMEHMLEHWTADGIAVFLAPIETPSGEVMARMVARELRWRPVDVLNKRWDKLALYNGLKDGKAALALFKDRLAILRDRQKMVHYFDHTSPSISLLSKEITAWAAKPEVRNAPARVIVPDHIGQLNYGPQGPTPSNMRDGLTSLQAIMRDIDATAFAPIQLNRTGINGLYDFAPPSYDWVQGSSAIEQMAQTLVVITRAPSATLCQGDPKVARKMIATGQATYTELAEPDRTRLISLKSRDLGQERDKAGAITAGRRSEADLVYAGGRLWESMDAFIGGSGSEGFMRHGWEGK